MTKRRRLVGIYAQVWKTYRAWAPPLLLLAVIVFVPLGLIDALAAEVDTEALDVTGGLQLAAFLAAVGAVITTSLFGEVFFSGAVAASLTHPEDQRAPGPIEIARRISYGKLIAVDLIFVFLVAIGSILFVLPGFLVFVYFALAGAAVEIEKRGVIAGFRRSWRLVRGHFWMVAAVVIPIEIAGDAIGGAFDHWAHALLGEGILSTWLGEAASNVITTPIFAIAVVLLTLELIHHHDGDGPTLNRHPDPLPVAESV